MGIERDRKQPIAKTAGEMNYTPEQIKQRAQAWYDRQITILAQAHGPSWSEHRAWIEDYLKEELRQRLIELGWRSKQ